MALRKLRHVILTLLALLAIGGVVGTLNRSMPAVHGHEPGDNKAAGSDKDSKASAEAPTTLPENLRERRTLLLKAFNQRMEQWQAGKAMLHPLKDDLRALLKVSDELSNTKERVAGLEECVKLARELVKATEAKAAEGPATEADRLEAKVLLLDVQAALLREQNKPARLTKENYDKIKQGTTTYKEVVEWLGEPDSTNRPLARGEMLQAIWIDGSKRINVAFNNDVVRLKAAKGIPGIAP
jgi:Domain of Unknown Function with PDB structure (DUF3862)